MNRSVAVFLVALVASGLLMSVALVSMDDGPTDEPSPAAEPATTAVNSTFGTSDQEFDRTTFEITVREDGSARWTFEYERTLETEQDTADFEAYAERFMDEELDLYTKFTEQASALVADGEGYTGREMSATEFNRSATVEQTFNTEGVVRMSFTWEGFASTDSGEIIVSDVFEGGFYIMEDQTLIVRTGENLAFDRVQPEPASEFPALHERDHVDWQGEQEFVGGRPYVVMVPQSEVESGGGPLSSFWTRLGLVLVGLTVLVAGGYLLVRRGTVPDPTDRLPDAVAGSFAFDSGDSDPGGTPAGSADAAGPSRPEGVSAVSDAELMTDEDRVTALLRDNGGRMKQVQIVEETDWSKSKVSMLLSEMESEGAISKLRVGRENIISLDGFEPEAARSPHENEPR